MNIEPKENSALGGWRNLLYSSQTQSAFSREVNPGSETEPRGESVSVDFVVGLCWVMMAN